MARRAQSMFGLSMSKNHVSMCIYAYIYISVYVHTVYIHMYIYIERFCMIANRQGIYIYIYRYIDSGSVVRHG